MKPTRTIIVIAIGAALGVIGGTMFIKWTIDLSALTADDRGTMVVAWGCAQVAAWMGAGMYNLTKDFYGNY